MQLKEAGDGGGTGQVKGSYVGDGQGRMYEVTGAYTGPGVK